MRKIVFLFIVLSTASVFAQSGDSASVDELIALEKKRSEAIAAHDTEFLKKLYTDDFRGVTATGYEVNKDTLMEVFQRDDPRVQFALEKLQARILGDTAIVTGRLLGKETASGKTVHDSLYIHVYQKRNGTWQIVAGQGTMIQHQ